MKALKIVGIVVAVLLLLLAGAAAFVASKFDPVWIKQELARVVKEQKQRDLRIDGDLRLSFFPSLGVRLGKTSLSEHAAADEFIGLDGARVAVRLMPLLSRQLVIDRIEVQGLRANIIRHKDGSFNFDDLLSKDKSESPPVRFDIDGVEISNGRLGYHDEANGRRVIVSEVNLHTGHLANAARGALKFSGRLGEPALAMELTGDYDVDLAAGKYSVADAKAKFSGEAGGLKQIEASFAVKKLAMAGAANFTVDGLDFDAKARQGEDAIEAKIQAPQIAIAGDKASGAAIAGNLRLTGKARDLNGTLEIAGLEGSAAALKVGKLGLRWKFNQGPTVVNGELASPLQANVTAQILDLPKLAGTVDITHPDMPMKTLKLPVTGSLHADLAKTNLVGDLATRFDETTLQSRWNVSRFAPLAAGFDLSIDRLNVDRYFPPSPTPTAGASAKPAADATAAPIDLSFLKGLDLKGAMRIGALQVSNAKISNFRADLRIKDGRLDINPLTAQAYEGSLAGSVSAQYPGNRLAAKQTLTNVAIEPLLKDVAKKDVLEGRGNVNLDVSASGATVDALKRSLGGTLAVQLHDGAIKGINLAKSLRELKAKVSSRQEAVQKASQNEKTDFSELAASFKIAGGVARNDDLSAKSPFLRLTGAGAIDLVQSRIDYLAKATVVGSAKGQEGKELDQLKGLTVPVHLTGPFDNLSYKLDFAAMVGDVVKEKAKEEVQRQVEKKAGGQLGGALKGLFKK
ncbi:MAG: AsmA family protein [Betaproteobacteria bacterium]